MPNFISSRLIFQLFQKLLIHHLPFTKLTTANSFIIETSHTLESDVIWVHRKGGRDKETTIIFSKVCHCESFQLQFSFSESLGLARVPPLPVQEL